MGEIGFVLLILAVLLVPVWFLRGIGNRVKSRMERHAPVPARSTKVVLSDLPAALPTFTAVPFIRTTESGTRSHLRNQASGMGMDPHAQDAEDAQAGGHGQDAF